MVSWNTNPYAGFLEDEPSILYGGFLFNQPNRSNSFLDYWNSNYNRVYGNYLNELGNQALRGEAPTLSFYEYLSKPDNSFMKQWQALSPWERGERPSARVNWNVF